jgi:hypothetical protein
MTEGLHQRGTRSCKGCGPVADVELFDYALLLIRSMPEAIRPERRQPSRLTNGTLRPCPDCGGLLEFRESYLVFRPERRQAEPAWVCQNRGCGYREFVRH